MDDKVNDSSTGLDFTRNLAVATGNKVDDTTNGLEVTFNLISALDADLEPIDLAALALLDLDALSDLPESFDTLLDRINDISSGLDSKAS